MSDLITKAELADILGVSRPMISKHARNGLFVNCTHKSGKLYKDEAIKAVKYSKKQGFTKKDKEIVDKYIPKELKQKEDTELKPSDDLLIELEELIKESLTPTQKVQVIKDFWTGELNKQKFLKENKELIPIADIKAVLDKIAAPFAKQLDELPYAIKSRFADIDDEAIEWLREHINNIKMDFQDITYD